MKATCEICIAPAQENGLCVSCAEAINRLITISSRFRVDFDYERMTYKLTATPTEELKQQGNVARSATPESRVVRRIVNFRL